VAALSGSLTGLSKVGRFTPDNWIGNAAGGDEAAAISAREPQVPLPAERNLAVDFFDARWGIHFGVSQRNALFLDCELALPNAEMESLRELLIWTHGLKYAVAQ